MLGRCARDGPAAPGRAASTNTEPARASMTAQLPEIIILDGKVFGLHSRPLDSYFRRIKWWPELGRDSGNWRGYVGRWEVFGDRLFLTGLFGKHWKVPRRLRGKLPPDPDPFEPAQD